MTQPRLIGLYSSRPQCGKSLVAHLLAAHHGYRVRKFARPLKAMLATLLREAGLGDEMVDAALEGPDKERPIAALGGVTSRYLMQSLGTEWGRRLIHPDLWVMIVGSSIASTLTAGGSVVVDDMRFPNEYELLRGMGALMVRVSRPLGPAAPAANSHASEGGLDGRKWDVELAPAEGPAAVALAVRKMLEGQA